MPFVQTSLELAIQQVAPCEDLLLEMGALSVTLKDPGGDPVLEPGPGLNPLWDYMVVQALFDVSADAALVRKRLAAELGEAALAHWQVEEIADRVWERAWMDDFVPMRFGQRLWVCPSNHTVDEPGAVVMKLDPGLAFGTGTHNTTALCLRWLDSQDLRGRHVLDYGCGSGILAVAALLLGADRCHGVDNDPQALLASRDNAERNAVAHRLSLALPEDQETEPADVLVANILSGILIKLAPSLSRLVRPGGALALSGILDTQVHDVADAFRGAFDLDEPVQDGDWMLLTGKRKA